jgi:hypothetical protein
VKFLLAALANLKGHKIGGKGGVQPAICQGEAKAKFVDERAIYISALKLLSSRR